MNNKKTDITSIIIMAGIGFGIGGGVSIISSAPFLLTTLTFTTTCAVISAAQTELISEAIKKINKNKKIKNSNIELHSATIEHVQELAKEKINTLTQEKINEIHARGHITAEEKVQEWEDMGLCAPGDAIGSAAHRCEKFGNCHDCLVDYASVKDEYEPFELKVSDTLFKDFNVQYLFKKENNDDLESEQIDEISKEERGLVKKLVPNKK